MAFNLGLGMALVCRTSTWWSTSAIRLRSMVINVKRAGYLLFMVGIVLGFGPYLRAQSGCEASAELSAPIAEFEARQVSPIEALLRFGAQYHVCFGFQYVDESFLTRPADFHLRDTTVRDAVLRILDSGPPLAVEQYYGVIEISRRKAEPQPTNIFDHVVPRWEANRGFVQLVSRLLHIQLVTDLNPEAKGFAIHAGAGDLHDEVGPFNEHNMSVKHLLDKIVAQSKGGAWVAQVQWGQQGNLSLPEERRIWTIVEYGGPNANYTTLLREIAAELGPSKSTESQR
jgi:hypothetical protein